MDKSGGPYGIEPAIRTFAAAKGDMNVKTWFLHVLSTVGCPRFFMGLRSEIEKRAGNAKGEFNFFLIPKPLK